MKSKLALLMTAVLVLSCASGPQPLMITVQQEEAVPSGPQQFCDGIQQLIDEGSQGYPSFRGRILASKTIYGNECQSGVVNTFHEAESPPWVKLTGCMIETMITEDSVFHEYTCNGTEWEDPDFLYQMMLDSLRVCFYGQYVIKKGGYRGYKKSTLENGGSEIIMSYFPDSHSKKESLFLTVSFFQRY